MSSREPGPGLRFRRVSQDDGAADGGGPVPFADRALGQLRTGPALEVRRTGNGASVRTRGSAALIARLRHPDEAELCLTWPVIERLGDALADDGRVRIEPGSDWVAMPLQGSSDLRLLLLLMSVAIRAHAPGTGERRPRP